MPIRKLSTEEAREIGSKGGKASVESRRNKKRLRETLLTLLDSKVPVKRPNGKVEDVEAREAITLALIRTALAGDVKAYCTIRDTIGELPTQNVDVTSGGEKINQRPQIVFSNTIEPNKDEE